MSNDLKEAFVAALRSQKAVLCHSQTGFFHHSTVRKIGGKTVVNCSRNGQPSKFTQRTDHAMLRDSAKHPRAALETLQVSVSMLNVRN